MAKLYQRWLKSRISQALRTRRVILLSGPRQCGKTTLAKQLVSSDTAYRTLDDFALRQLASNDPRGFVLHEHKTLVIDEIQRVPELLSAIKMAVDQNTRPGQYLLTGSANIQSLPGAIESLAGRVRKLRLRPLSQGEILQTKPTFFERAFKEDFGSKQTRIYGRQDILDFSLRGGFPEVLNHSHREQKNWHTDYIDALIERDLKDVAQINRQDAMRQLVKILAAWSSKQIDISAIGAGLSIKRPTIESYINALEALFIIERVSPWIKTDYDRVGKSSKIFMTDSGLMASILGWKKDQAALDSDRSGKLVETFIFNELSAQIDASETEYSLYHYRDREQREIDFLIEREDQMLLGIEVKAGSAIKLEHFKHLIWFRDNIARKKKSFIGIVLYAGGAAGRMGDGLWAVPFNSLWR